jgi:hypothetical protein
MALGRKIVLVLVLAIGAFGYSRYQRHWLQPEAAAGMPTRRLPAPSRYWPATDATAGPIAR